MVRPLFAHIISKENETLNSVYLSKLTLEEVMQLNLFQ